MCVAAKVVMTWQGYTDTRVMTCAWQWGQTAQRHSATKNAPVQPPQYPVYLFFLWLVYPREIFGKKNKIKKTDCEEDLCTLTRFNPKHLGQCLQLIALN